VKESETREGGKGGNGDGDEEVGYILLLPFFGKYYQP
jgi:hypothetical protein